MSLPVVHRGRVLKGWIDRNHHMNSASYLLAFNRSIDGLYDRIGFDEETRGLHGRMTFIVETHLFYAREMHLDARFHITAAVVGFDRKRLGHLYTMYRSSDGLEVATAIFLSLFVDTATRRVASVPDDLASRFAGFQDAFRQAASSAIGSLPGPARQIARAAFTIQENTSDAFG